MPKQRWVFEPRHTAAEFSAIHMMANVRGHFKNIEGDRDHPDCLNDVTIEATINAADIWTGDYRSWNPSDGRLLRW